MLHGIKIIKYVQQILILFILLNSRYKEKKFKNF